jgi:hypothetical protein
MKAKVTNLPDEDHVMRYVSWARLRRDEDDNILGFLGAAFQLRPDEESLSVNWLEYFDGDRCKNTYVGENISTNYNRANKERVRYR